MGMHRERPEAGMILALVGAILLFVSLFLDWYSLPGFTITAWTAFEVWDLVLALLALAVVASVAARLGWWRGPTHSMALEILGLAAVVIVASQLINYPPRAAVPGSDVGDGGWLALVGAVMMAAGALLAEARVTVSFNPAGPGAVGGTPGPGRASAWRRSRATGGTRAAADVPMAPGVIPSPAADRVVSGDRVVRGARGDEETAVGPVPPRSPRL
jgi:hypothetical protein